MSTAVTPSDVGGHGHEPAGARAGHHDPHLAHHFDTPEQQFSSAKLGMWVFLGTEILMFGGLFCAYAIYRHNHPLVFKFAAESYLNVKWGTLNTIVLITSSLTMAWGVRAAQLNQNKLLIVCLILTLMGALGFMVIKSIEYSAKWNEHVFVGYINKYNADNEKAYKLPPLPRPEAAVVVLPSAAATQPTPREVMFDANTGIDISQIKPRYDYAVNSQTAIVSTPVETPSPESTGMTEDEKIEGNYRDLSASDQWRVNTFFSIYFLMTGLHGVHVLVGMGLISWLLIRAVRREFSSEYFTPVDLIGLYWHLVDLIWIFLFPLLYLIH
jgi:cytochrome c oxidase subunit III